MTTNPHITTDPAAHLPNKLAADFPGWGAPDYADYLIPIQPGEPVWITDVESHGAAPFTRYSVEFPDGSRAYGIDPAIVVGA